MRKSLTVFLSGVALVYAASTALAGEGAYANATGTGTIESAPNTFKGVNLLNIKLIVKTPGS
jgi:hypothetical protein